MIYINKIKNILDYYFNIICIGLIIFLISGVAVLIYRSFDTPKTDNSQKIKIADDNISDEKAADNIKVDIKGAVKKPGVYELSNNSNVLDLINAADGLTKNASTNNINLSKILEDQMVIKIYTKDELKKSNNSEKISECVCDKVEISQCLETNAAIIKPEGENMNIETSVKEEINTNKLISINTATKEELMTLNSIGESKANAIIEYRNKNGLFSNIEDLKKVSGIGDALFEKIKNNITI